MKKAILNVLLILVGIAAAILIAKSLGSVIFHFVAAGVITFCAEWLIVFIASLTGFAPVGTNGGGWSPSKARYIAAGICLLVALFWGGVFGIVGALVGSLAARFYFRGAL
jgi:hypothetical protein